MSNLTKLRKNQVSERKVNLKSKKNKCKNRNENGKNLNASKSVCGDLFVCFYFFSHEASKDIQRHTNEKKKKKNIYIIRQKYVRRTQIQINYQKKKKIYSEPEN